ncbi:MAG TPA: hypothetical protein VGC88_05760 [Terriglobales bacterium]|jgi:hypothetical protein
MFGELPESGSEGNFAVGFIYGIGLVIASFIVSAVIGGSVTTGGGFEATVRNTGRINVVLQILWAVLLERHYRKRGERLTGYGILVPASIGFLLATACSVAT